MQSRTTSQVLVTSLLTMSIWHNCISQATAQPAGYKRMHYSPNESRAIELFKQGKYDLAADTVSLDLQTTNSFLKTRRLNILAVCLAKQGKDKEAKKAFAQSEQLASNNLHIGQPPKPNELVISACRLKLLFGNMPEAVILKRYPWMKGSTYLLKSDAIDLINQYDIVPKDSFEQAMG